MTVKISGKAHLKPVDTEKVDETASTDVDNFIPEIGLTKSEITRRLRKPFPPEAIKEREGGRGKMLKYVDTMTVINRLIEATNNTFQIDVVREPEIFGDIMMVYTTITIPGFMPRTHVGVQKLKDRNGNYLSEDMFKGAPSDGIKKAASLLGVAGELYGPDYEQLGKPVELSTKEKLSVMLKSNGFKKISEVNAKSNELYEKDFNDLTEKDMANWLADLERTEPVPF